MEKRIRKIGALVVVGMFVAMLYLPGVIAPDGETKVETDGNYRIDIDNNNDEYDRNFTVSHDDGAELFRVQENGRAGIGTTSPFRKLEILDDSNPQLRLSNSDAFYADLQTTNDGYLFINPVGGRVGIGTASPGAALDVEVSSGGAATIGHYQNSATGHFAVAMGEWTTASGVASTAMGGETTASGTYSVAMGNMAEARGDGSVAMGYVSKASDFCSIAVGWCVDASGMFSGAIGSFVTAGPAYSTYVIGKGVDWDNRLVNNIEKSFMVGFDSTEPTLFVNGSSVGIGTTGPSQTLHVEGNARITGALYDSNNDAGTSGQVLMTTGIGIDWVDPSPVPDGDWDYTTNPPHMFSIPIGNVGIGTTSPVTTLDVDGGFATNIVTKYHTDDGYTPATSDYTILVDADSATQDLDINLPAASGREGQILVIKRIDDTTCGHEVVINRAGSDLIDGSWSKTLDTQWESRTIQSDGSNWYILASQP